MDERVELVILRCAVCGDTFPIAVEGDEEVKCRNCGSEDLSPAHEPLL